MAIGSTLALMQRDLALIDSDSARDAREMLDLLEDTARDRFAIFYEKIRPDDRDEYHMRVNEVPRKYTYIGVAMGEDNLVWMDEVKETVEGFPIGPFAGGLASVATSTIFKMIHSNAGRFQARQRFAISPDVLGGVSRLDYFIFTYTFNSTELARRKASLIACCVVESSAVVKNIDANTLRVIISCVFRGQDTPHSTLTTIYNQFAMAINRPVGSLSLAEMEKGGLDNWREPVNRKLQTDAVSTGREIVAFLSTLSIIESVECIVRELVGLSAQLTMLRCVTVRIQGIHKAACGGGCCRCTSELCSHACSLSQEYHMKRHAIPKLCSERGGVALSIPPAGHQTEKLKTSLLPTRSSMVRET